MKQFSGFESKKSGGREHLPVGGYVAKIMKTEEVIYDWGRILLVNFEIAEGEYKDFFSKDFKSQDGEDKKWRGTYRLNIPRDDGSEKDGWTKRTFGGAIWSIENSNPGYRWEWDETTLKGKSVGVLYRNREWEYNGQTGWSTECCALTDVESIRAGSFKIPKDKPLTQKKNTESVFASADEDDSDLPF